MEDLFLPDTLREDKTKNVFQCMIHDLLRHEKNNPDAFENEASFFQHVRQLQKKYKTSTSKTRLRGALQTILGLHPQCTFAKHLVQKAVRSRSGIINVSIVLPPHRFSCRHDCHFCPKEPGIPRSYLSNEDAVARATQVEFDPIRQVDSRCRTLENNGHVLDKIEFRLLGGTFSSYPHDVILDFVRNLYYAVNTYKQETKRPPSSLKHEQRLNETAQIHVVGLGLETRPDAITVDEIARFRRLGCTRVELGVQHTDDDLLKRCNRGHGVRESKEAIKLLKDHGFKIEMHIMLDLPGSSPEKDEACYRRVLQTDPDLLPDYLKDYPCLDVSFTKIKEWKQDGRWQSYAEASPGAKDLRQVLVYRQRITPRWVRVNRIQRDFVHVSPNTSPLGYTSETLPSNLAQIVRQDAERQGIFCQCIRCCEVRDEVVGSISLIRYRLDSFVASGNQEYFISAFVERSPRPLLLGFLRLRLVHPGDVHLPELKPYAQHGLGIIRELHVYGRVVPVAQDSSSMGIQHSGIGKTLLSLAEGTCLYRHGTRTMVVIAGVGVRKYYEKLGYVLQQTYMTKILSWKAFLSLLFWRWLWWWWCQWW